VIIWVTSRSGGRRGWFGTWGVIGFASASAPFIPILLLLKFFIRATLLCVLRITPSHYYPLPSAGRTKDFAAGPQKEGYDPISIIKEAAAAAHA
jgi:hypothetical protein